MGTWAARGRPALCLRSPTSPLRQRAGSAASPWNAAWKSRTRPSPAQRAHHLVIGERLLRLAMKDDLAAIDYVEPIGDRRRTHEIGFGDQQRDAKGLDSQDRLTKTFHDGGREPFEGLVEDQEIRSERHGPGDRPIFRWPPLKFCPCRSTSWRTSGNTASARASVSPWPGAPRSVFCASHRLIIRFSATVSSGKIPEFSGA